MNGHKTANQCMMASHQVLLPSIWCCATESGHVVSAICDKWQRYTCGWQSHATNHKCHQSPSTTTHHWSCMPHHTHQSTHTMLHTHGWMAMERLDDHTVMTNTPWFDGNHSLHQHHCGAQHPHPTHHSCRLLGGAMAIPMPLCTPPVALESVVLCMPCVAIPLLSLLSTPLPFSLTLFVIGSHSVSNTFTSEQVTLPTHLCKEGDSVDDTLQTRHTG